MSSGARVLLFGVGIDSEDLDAHLQSTPLATWACRDAKVFLGVTRK